MICGIHYFITKLKTKIDVIPRSSFNVTFSYLGMYTLVLKGRFFEVTYAILGLQYIITIQFRDVILLTDWPYFIFCYCILYILVF